MTNNVLVTGGAGFVGGHLVDQLVKDGHQVTVIDNYDPQAHPPGHKEYRAVGAEYVVKDIRFLDEHPQFIRANGVEVIVHLAAAVGVGQSMYRPRYYADANVGGTASLLQALVDTDHDVKKLVVASSMSIYGEGQYVCPSCGPADGVLRSDVQLKNHEWANKCPHCGGAMTPVATCEDKRLCPESVYATTKRDQEEMCLSIGKAYGLPTVALRYFNIYGPRQCLSNPYTGICAIFSGMIKAGKPPLVYEDGGQSRDFVSVHDITRANILAINSSRMDYEAFNVGTGRPVSVLDVASMLTKLYGASFEPQVVGSYRPGDIRHCYADISKIRRVGYEPKTDLETGLSELVAWGRDETAVDRVDAAQMELQAKGLLK